MAEYYASSTAAYRIEHVRGIVEFFEPNLDPTYVVTDSRALRDSMMPNVPFRYNRWVKIYYRNVKYVRDAKIWDLVWKNGKDGNHGDVLTKVVRSAAKYKLHQEFISGITHSEAAEIFAKFNARPSDYQGKIKESVEALMDTINAMTALKFGECERMK